MADMQLVKREDMKLRTFGPQTFTEAMEFSTLVAKSDLAPRDYRGKPENVFLALQMGAEVGLSPMQAIQNISVINGRPCLWGDGALAVVQAHPDYEWHKEFEEGTTAVFEIKRKGHDVHTVRFGDEDAKTARLADKEGPWRTYPKRMKQMRARGFGIRDKFADALRGIITAEEAEDIPPETPDEFTEDTVIVQEVSGKHVNGRSHLSDDCPICVAAGIPRSYTCVVSGAKTNEAGEVIYTGHYYITKGARSPQHDYEHKSYKYCPACAESWEKLSDEERNKLIPSNGKVPASPGPSEAEKGAVGQQSPTVSAAPQILKTTDKPLPIKSGAEPLRTVKVEAPSTGKGICLSAHAQGLYASALGIYKSTPQALDNFIAGRLSLMEEQVRTEPAFSAEVERFLEFAVLLADAAEVKKLSEALSKGKVSWGLALDYFKADWRKEHVLDTLKIIATSKLRAMMNDGIAKRAQQQEFKADDSDVPDFERE